MEKHETIKTLEKTKAKIIFAIIVLVLLLPTLISRTSNNKLLAVMLALPLLVVLLYKRLRRLNYKINTISK